jgi:membrane protein DedA with SNARE-associated domain
MDMSDVLSALLHLSQHDYSRLAQFFSLVLLPFAHEDLAIILGAYIVVNDIMPVALVALCIYGGMVASDFALYGIGAGARHLPWLSRLAVNDRVRSFAQTVKRNLFGIVALGRVVPGVVFLVFVACGWARVPLVRFTVASLIVSALYLPLMLCIAVVFGDTLESRAGGWTWPFLLCVVSAIGFLRRQVFNFQEEPSAADGKRPVQVVRRDFRKVAASNRVPLGLFYLPLIASWIGFASRYRSLTLPTIANPCHPTRGVWGESRCAYLVDVTGRERRYVADFVAVTRSVGQRTLFADLDRARQLFCGAGLTFPLIAKPDVGRHGVCRIDDVPALREYLRHFPAGEKVILQRFVPHTAEAAVLYARLPGTQSGRILSLTFRAGEHWRDAWRHVTPELEARIDAIARSMREFHYGRFHLRFGSTDDLMHGENFSVVEITGISGGTSPHWDPPLPLTELYGRLVDQQRIIFLIGEKNRARGFAPIGCTDILKSFVRQSPFSRRYPASA